MGLSTQDPANAYPDFSNPRHANLPTYSSTNPSYHRVHTYTAHALILLNFYGIPLSSGLWLEYYFTNLYPSASLLAISAIFGAQFACLGLGVGTTASLYRRWPNHWRLQMFFGGLSVCGAHLGLLVTDNFWVLALCQGALAGLGLGVLGTTSVRALSTHYKNDTAVASTQCVAAGFFGAGVYTGSTWICLRSDNVRLGHGITLILLSLTLLPATLLANPRAPYAHQQVPPASSTGPRTTRFTLLSLLTALCLAPSFLPPLLLPLILTRHPSPYRADTGCYTLLALFSAGLSSSALFPKLPSCRLSPTTLVSASALLAGISVIPLLWVTSLYVAVPCAVVFGLGLGGVCTLWFKALAALVKGGQGLERWHYLLVAVGGVGAGCALVGSAAVLERWEVGVAVVLGAVAGCLGLGGVVLGVGAAVRDREEKKGWVA